jgi:predicted phosphodiesterase
VRGYNQLNEECIEYLKGALAKLNTKVVVITHHMPSESLINSKYLEGELRNYNQWFYCDMDAFILEHKYPIACWIYGHTHTPSVSSVYGVPMLCNPMGYPGENSDVNFQKVFDLGEKN